MWGFLDIDGDRYAIAGGPRGVFLWAQGNPGTDISGVILFAFWHRIVARFAETNVVEVRKRSKGHFVYRVIMKRRFPRSTDLSECVVTVERELRAIVGAAAIEEPGKPRPQGEPS